MKKCKAKNNTNIQNIAQKLNHELHDCMSRSICSMNSKQKKINIFLISRRISLICTNVTALVLLQCIFKEDQNNDTGGTLMYLVLFASHIVRYLILFVFVRCYNFYCSQNNIRNIPVLWYLKQLRTQKNSSNAKTWFASWLNLW